MNLNNSIIYLITYIHLSVNQMKEKSQDIRVKECIEIRKQMAHLGIDILPELEPLFGIMNDFIRHGTSASGKIDISSIHRTAHYVFTNRAEIVSHICLKNNK